MGDGERVRDGIKWERERVREEWGKGRKKKEKKKKKPVWADMMKHSLLCGIEAKVIYTSTLHAEIKENGTEMPVKLHGESVKNSTAKEYLD